MTQFLLLSRRCSRSRPSYRDPAADPIANGLNWWILYIALPALALELPTLHFSRTLWFVVVARWAMFMLSVVLVALARCAPAVAARAHRRGRHAGLAQQHRLHRAAAAR
ncbi:MAG: hypothetical protein U1F30_10140 [Steroidobacteraceae bacterium]